MNKINEILISRRTIRKYKTEQITDDELNEIIDVGLHAPTAGGAQSSIIVVSQDADLNNELGKISRTAENLDDVRMGRVSTEQPSIVDDSSIKSAFYGAPTVITIFAKKDNYNQTGDCFVAAENIILSAWTLGIGSCLVGRAYKTFATEMGQEIQKSWGISSDYEARLHVTLGYPDGEVPKYKQRNEGRVIRV